MAILTSTWISDFNIVVITLLTVAYLFLRKRYNYWAERNVPYSKPTYILGNMGWTGIKKSFAQTMRDLYNEAGDAKVYGLWKFITPTLIIKDMQVVRHVLVKDFDCFHDRGVHIDEKSNPLSEPLFVLTGSKWKNLRNKMSPIFTSGKMKHMFPTFITCSEQLNDYLTKVVTQEQYVDIKKVSSKFSLNIIGTCVLGIGINAFEDPNNKLMTMGNEFFQPGAFQFLKNIILFSFPTLAKKLKFELFPKEVQMFFHDVVKETMEYREEHNVVRNDFLQLLMQLKNEPNNNEGEDEKFNSLKAASAAFIFFIAGFENSSTTMQFATYELAFQPAVQDKLRKEILRVLANHNGNITYESLQEMEYLDHVVNETLRKYPVSPSVIRTCTKRFQIPDTDIVIDKGCDVIVPLLGIHYDPKHYPNPEVFDPERFTVEQKSNRDHFAFLPFGEGPRNCLGLRFGVMQTKVGLVTLIRDFKFEICEKTPKKIKFNTRSNLVIPAETVELKVTKINS